MTRWNKRELARIEKNRAENREKSRNAAPPPTEEDRRNRERNRRSNQASPGRSPDRGERHERRYYVVTSEKCTHGKVGELVELDTTGAVLALVEAGALRLYVKAAIRPDAKEASDG